MSITFPSEDGKTATVVLAPRSPRPVYVGAESDFYIRDGNSTRKLNSEEAVRYIKEHFASSS